MPRCPLPPSGGSVRPAVGLAALLVLRGALVFAAAGAASPLDAGDHRKAEASAHLKRGAELIDAEDLEGALAQFEEAYRLVPSPSILHNFGIVYEGMGRKAAALDCFQRFLAEASQPPPAAREHAERAVQTLLGEVAELRIEAELAGAGIFVDGRRVGDTPQEKSIYLDPGPHHLSVEKPGVGTVHAERIEVSAGQHLTVRARAAHIPPPTVAALPVRGVPGVGMVKPAIPRVEPSSRRWQRPAAWVAAVAATLAGGVLVAEILRHDRYGRDFNHRGCGLADAGQGPEGCADLASRADDAKKWATVSGAIAGVLGVGAAVLFLSLPERSGDRAIGLRASPSRLGLLLQVRF